jgi:hypothetical protein
MAERLQTIADGNADISADDSCADPVAITEASKTYNNGRLML